MDMWTSDEYQYTNSQTNGWLKQEEALLDQMMLEQQAPNDHINQLNETTFTSNDPFPYYAPKADSPPVPIPSSNNPLRSILEIPKNYQSIYKYSYFNRMQSEAMDQLLYSDENTVVSAPTGTGKTALLEMAMIRCLSVYQTQQNYQQGSIKMIYMAPTKSLCAEKVAHWKNSFGPLGIVCEEFTGDSDYASIDSIRNSSIIVTTPEKWDSMTRKWVDHRRLVELIKLMMIDEIHILKEARGATLEVCVSRMKAMNRSMRIVAVSATIPNLQDVTTWLDAKALTFSEEYRPIRLDRYVYGYPSKGRNIHAFEKTLDWKLLDIIVKYGDDKPVLIFCSTRAAAQSACETLLKLMDKKSITSRVSNNNMELKNKKLYGFVQRGIGFHHAGLDITDRRTVEQLFLTHQLGIVATTSTLAVGVNLPAHLVIIKSTKCYQNGGYEEYSDIDILQMIGRAGRPGLDTSGCAVIMTSSDMENKFTSLVSCQSIIESSLHRNLTEHLMSEICIGTIVDLESSVNWLGSTFLCTRVKQNPTYYQQLYCGESLAKNPDEVMQDICLKDMKLLIAHNLVTISGEGYDTRHEPTFYGTTMNRYYIQFKTMVKIMQSTNWVSIKNVLELVSQSEEFETYRYSAHEKSILNDLRSNSDIRFPLQNKVSDVPDKIFIMIQCVLGDINLYHPLIGNSMNTASLAILQKACRITKCIVDCAAYEKNAVKLKHSLDFYRCMNAKMWSTSPFILRQIDGIGVQTAKTLSQKNISSFEQLRSCDPGRLEMILHRNPPFGTKIHTFLSSLPYYYLDLKQKRDRKNQNQPSISLSVRVGLSSVPKGGSRTFGKGFFTILWIETSEHTLVDFRRIKTETLANRPSDLQFHVQITSPSMMVICHVQSEDFVGLDIMKQLKPEVDPIQFITLADPMTTTMTPQNTGTTVLSIPDSNEDDMDAALDTMIDILDEMNDLKDVKVEPPSPTLKKKSITSKKNVKNPCKHRCKDKQRCKHECCKRGPPPDENMITSYSDFNPISNHISNNTTNTDSNSNRIMLDNNDENDIDTTTPSYYNIPLPSILPLLSPPENLTSHSLTMTNYCIDDYNDVNDDYLDLTVPSDLDTSFSLSTLGPIEMEDDWEITDTGMDHFLSNMVDLMNRYQDTQPHPTGISSNDMFGDMDISMDMNDAAAADLYGIPDCFLTSAATKTTTTNAKPTSCDWMWTELAQMIYDTENTTRTEDMDMNGRDDDMMMMTTFETDSTDGQDICTLDQHYTRQLPNLIKWAHDQIGTIEE